MLDGIAYNLINDKLKNLVEPKHISEELEDIKEQERLLHDEFIADVRRTVKQLEDYKKVGPRKGIWLFATDAIESERYDDYYYSYGLDIQGIYRFKNRAIDLAIKYVKNIDFEYYKQIKEASQSLCQYLYIEQYSGTRVVDSFYNWLTNT